MSLPNEVFLSHSHRDLSDVVRLANVLRLHGVPVWYSERNILGAQQWHDEIGRALQRCDWFVLVMTPAAVESLWVKRELVFALEEARYAERIIPLLFQPCEWRRLSWTLSASQVLDFTGDFEAACRELLRIWGLGLKGEAAI